MRAHQDIEFSSQVTGAELPPGARKASIIEQLRHAVIASIFSPKGDQPHNGGIGLDFDQCLARFRAEMAFADGLNAVNLSLLERLGIAGEGNGAAWVRLYVAGLHAVATVVSQFEYRCQIAQAAAGVDDGAAEVRKTSPGATISDAYRLLSYSLRRIIMSAGVSPVEGEEAPPNPLAVAKATVESVVASTGDCFTIVPKEVHSATGELRTVHCITVSADLLARLIALTRRLPHVFTLQPLNEPPSYYMDHSGATKPDPETTTRHNLIDWAVSTPFLRKFADTCHQPEFLQGLLTAVNAQQAVRWRVNRKLMEWVRVMAWLDTTTHSKKMPEWLESFSEPVQRAFEACRRWPPDGIQIRRLLEANVSSADGADRAVLLRSTGAAPLSSLTKARQSPTTVPNPLDNPLVSSVFASLGLDDKAGEYDKRNTFFLAWFADFRGRIYVDTPWFSPQGADIQRAMLEFGDGQVLNEGGRRALKRHGGGLARRAHVLQDLEITGRSVVTFAERERWIDMHHDQIRASAKNPLEHAFWYHVSADPLQFLAFCLEWDRQASDPTAPCHLPVQVDGSCSGLQHMSALTSSRPLAQAVNVEGRADGLPADIYADLATAVQERLPGLSEVFLGPNADEKAAIKAQAYQLLNERAHWVNRDAAKKVVMTVPYGAGPRSQASHVLDSFIENHCPLGKEDADALDALGRWILETSDGASASNSEAVEHETAVWWGLSRLAYYVAIELRVALNDKYPAAAKFEGAVSRIAQAILLNRGAADRAIDWPPQNDNEPEPDLRVPLAWPAPSGVAVVQPRFKDERCSVSITSRRRTVAVRYVEHLPQIDIAKQINGLMPNLIHSLDATHLNRTIRTITKKGILSFGTIHDCIQCLPNDLETVDQVLRDQFVKLYAPHPESCLPKVLVEWYEWMALVHDVVRVPQPKHLLRALKAPPGAMAAEAERAGLPAQWAVRESQVPSSLVDRIRGLSAMHRAIMNRLIEALAAEPLHNAALMASARKFPALDDFRCDRDEPLDLDRVRQSEYFFS